MNKYFPLNSIPPRQFEIGDRVFSFLADIDDGELRIEGTVFGYQYQDKLWTVQGSQLNLNTLGWIYAVVQTNPDAFLLEHFAESDLIKMENSQVDNKPFSIPPKKHQTFPIPVYMPEDKTQQIITRSSNYLNILKGISSMGAVSVTLHDNHEESGFMYLDLDTYDPRRLNKQKPDLLGNPCTIVDPSIGEPRKYWIEKAISNGENIKYSYAFDDKVLGIVFRFDVDIIYLPGKEELITVVTDADKWQRQFWAKYNGEYQRQYYQFKNE